MLGNECTTAVNSVIMQRSCKIMLLCIQLECAAHNLSRSYASKPVVSLCAVGQFSSRVARKADVHSLSVRTHSCVSVVMVLRPVTCIAGQPSLLPVAIIIANWAAGLTEDR